MDRFTVVWSQTVFLLSSCVSIKTHWWGKTGSNSLIVGTSVTVVNKTWLLSVYWCTKCSLHFWCFMISSRWKIIFKPHWNEANRAIGLIFHLLDFALSSIALLFLLCVNFISISYALKGISQKMCAFLMMPLYLFR